jgi:hypothetical protein
VATAVETEMIEVRVGEGMSIPIGINKEAVVIAEERKVVGEAFSRTEVSAGSKPGGGCISCIKELGEEDIEVAAGMRKEAVVERSTVCSRRSGCFFEAVYEVE